MDLESQEQTRVEEVKEDAAEIQADIKETKAEASQARADGDDARATQLEARVDALSTDLGEIKDVLKKLADRPFAPAPQAKKTEETSTGPETKTPEPERPKERQHRFGSPTWFGNRAYED